MYSLISSGTYKQGKELIYSHVSQWCVDGHRPSHLLTLQRCLSSPTKKNFSDEAEDPLSKHTIIPRTLLTFVSHHSDNGTSSSSLWFIKPRRYASQYTQCRQFISTP
jgi:hypothetical protein